MIRPRPRPVTYAIAALATAAALGLAGCSGGTDTAPGAGAADSADKQDDAAAFRAQPDLAGTTALTIEAEFTPVEESDAARLLAPGVDLRITQVAQTDTLSAEVLQDLGGELDQADDEATVESVQAAEGQVFWVAEYSSDDPQWEPRGELPDSTASLALSGNEIADVFDTAEGTMHRGTVVASLPADADPQTGVLQVETDGEFQALSLVDGSRVASDVEHIYDSAGAEVQVDSAEEFEETFEGWTGDQQRLAGSVSGGFVTPWLSSRDGGDGWAGPCQVYLAVTVDWAEISATTDDETGIYVELADGTTVRQHDPPVYLSSPFEDDPVFLIPAETEQVTVVLEPQVTVGAGSTAETHTWDSPAAELTISAT